MFCLKISVFVTKNEIGDGTKSQSRREEYLFVLAINVAGNCRHCTVKVKFRKVRKLIFR